MPRISKSTIDEVQGRLDAAAVVNDYVRLEKRGGRYLGLCPFHSEKTPSFQVNSDLKLYYCFGCHKGGTILDFVMEMDKLSFPEAIETLARKFGVPVVYDDNAGAAGPDAEAQNRRKEELFELYRRMAGTFQHFLHKMPEGEAAKGYIVSRGVSDKMIEAFRLGYAPSDRRWLHAFLLQKGYSGDFLASSGLFSANYRELPLFSGRLMFPIADRQGRVVAFGGRALSSDGDAPKYINSPETAIYRKGETLFALDAAVPEIRRTKTVYIAEGYMDVIALHQAGISNSVAPLGTAFTETQAKLLRRWADRAVLVFDSDRAGQEAAVKAVLLCRKTGLPCSAIVPDEDGSETKDPADILRNSGPEVLQKKMKCFITDFDYLLRRAVSLYDTSGSEGKAKGAAFIFPYLETLDSDVSRDACIEAAALAFRTNRDAIYGDFLRRSRAGAPGAGPVQRLRAGEIPHGRTQGTVSMSDELFLLMVVAANDMAGTGGALYPLLRKAVQVSEINNPDAKELFIAMEECFANDEKGAGFFLARLLRPELKEFFLRRSASAEFLLNARKLMEDGIRGIKRKKLEAARDELIFSMKNIKTGGAGLSEPLLDDLIAEKMEIDEELRRLKENS